MMRVGNQMEETNTLEIFLKNNRLPRGVRVVRMGDQMEIRLGRHLISAIMMSLVWVVFGVILGCLHWSLSLLALIPIGLYLCSYGTEHVICIDQKADDFSIVTRFLRRGKPFVFKKQTVLPVFGSLMDPNGSMVYWLDIYLRFASKGT